MNESFRVIAEAFSRTGERYDAFAQDHPNLARMRGKVYAHLDRYLPENARILELNAGTGIDAVALVGRGHTVHATDIAPGMLERAKGKARRLGLHDRISFQECSFTRLGEIQGAPYDAVFSNLGGLNCVPDLSPVIRQLPGVLKPGGLVTWVLMPPICLWEMAELLRGHPRVAFRRLARNGTHTHLEGLYFTIYYFKPRQVAAWFGPAYEPLALEGLSVFTPTAESKNVPTRFPGLYRLLVWLDERLSQRSPWRSWGDFYILSMRRSP
jgi:ubiquinone/menaquinone biosynthesis C-methylase UbiE